MIASINRLANGGMIVIHLEFIEIIEILSVLYCHIHRVTYS